MSSNVDLNVDKIGTKLFEPTEKEPDKQVVNSDKNCTSSPSSCVAPHHHLSTRGDPAPTTSSDPTESLTTAETRTDAVAASQERPILNSDENSSVQSDILNKLPVVNDDHSSDDSLTFKFADSVISSTTASAVTESGSSESHLAAKKDNTKNLNESDFSSISADSSLSAISIYDTNSDSSSDVTRLKRDCDDKDNLIDAKNLKLDRSFSEEKGSCSSSKTFTSAVQKDPPKLPKSDKTTESKADSLEPSGVVENLVSDDQNLGSSPQVEEIVAQTEVPPPGDHSMISNVFELSNSNSSFPETLLEGVHAPSLEFCSDSAEDCENLNVSSEDLASCKMKGEVVAAPMPIPETRSPMIHIPASIVSEFMNSESSLSPVVGKSVRKSTSPIDNYLDELSKSNDDFSGDTIVANGSSKSLCVAEKSQSLAVEVTAGSRGEERSSCVPLIGSTPPDSRPAKPASPAALSNLPIPVPSSQSHAAEKMDISNDLDPLEKPATSPLTNGKCESSSLNASSDQLGDVSNFGNSTVSEDSMSRPLLTPLTGTVVTPVLLADEDLPQSTDITELAPVRTTYVSSSHSAASTSTHPDNNITATTNLLDVRNTESPEVHQVSDSEKTNLKRSHPPEDEQNTKKLRLSHERESSQASAETQAIEDDASKALVEAEVLKLKHTASKLRKLKRKDLENMVIELFMNKVLHNHELGKYKTLCEKLESTLESNRKKAAQFHKELEDLRKVTRKLQEEHQNRKDHLVTPIKIKRSVGIQAAPHIIQKGIAAACGESSKTQNRFPHAMSNGASSQQSMMVIGNSGIGTQASQQSGPPQNSVMRTSFVGGRLGMANGSPGDRRGSSQSLTSQMNSVNKSNAVIDLTDEEESRTSTAVSSVAAQVSKTPHNLVKVTAASGFVSLPTTTGAAQYVLVPSSAAGAGNTVVVAAANMGTNSLAGSSNTSTRLLLPSGSSVMNSKTNAPSLLAPPVMAQQQQCPHPAPLPRTAPQQVVGGAKQLPPQPTLKLSHKDNSIVLSWTMAKTSEHEAIASYQLFAYQESNQPPSPALWKKVGSVKALELPMACTLTQFMPGHRYHFAVRAVDAKSRLGPFSDPRSIRLEK
ncbi:Fibronectin type III [Trinorchestia longiramus]|nr:Fibronectin type III [Trinorchestia longiramus]